MVNSEIIENLVKKEFGNKIFKKSLNLSTNSIKIIEYLYDPMKLRSIIFENEREFHLIIDDSKMEIFHDCPTFLIYSDRNKKICHHLIKVLTLLNPKDSLKVIQDIDSYNLTYEDFGSKKKSKNFLILAQKNIETKNFIEALNYLKKALINQNKSSSIIKKYLETAIENNLFIEFFEFVESCYLNDFERILKIFDDLIEIGFKKFLGSIKDYSFFHILKIISNINIIFQFKSLDFLKNLKKEMRKLLRSKDFKSRYFCFYLFKTRRSELENVDTEFISECNLKDLALFEEKVISYFLNQIEKFTILEELILLKEQLELMGISSEKYQKPFKEYQKEIQELEKKVYLKKFAFLKLIAEKYNVKKSKLNFRKKRNMYVVTHDKDNINNPAYQYIINLIGFFGLEFDTIKSSDIGINYFLFKDLFLDDFNQFPDIFYYKNQFWGESDFNINVQDGYSLLKSKEEYYDKINFQSHLKKSIILVEWELSKKPIKANIVNAIGSQLIIPDQNSPLFHDLKPFDITICNKDPVKIEGDYIKNVNVISKVPFKTAISLVNQGIDFIEGYYPFSLIVAVKNKDLNPFKAFDIALNNPNKLIIPNYEEFLRELKEFLYNFINRERDYVFNLLRQNPIKNTDHILSLLNLKAQISGLDLPFSRIVGDIFIENVNLIEFKKKFLDTINKEIQSILDSEKSGLTEVFDIEKMKDTPFQKYIKEIVKLRKYEIETAKIDKLDDLYDITELLLTYYGKKFAKILDLKNEIINSYNFKKLKDIAERINIDLNVLD
jgi:hypothetical protein